MSVSLIIGGEPVGQFATNRGTGDFFRWVNSMPVEAVPLLSHLVDWGWVNDLPQLEVELEASLGTETPATVKTTGAAFLRRLRERRPGAETVILGSGMVSDDG